MTPSPQAILPLVCCSSEPDSSAGESVIHSLPPVHHAPSAPHTSHPGPYTPTPYPPYGYPAPPQHALAVAPLPGSTGVRNPFEQHSIQDAIRTQDADLPVRNMFKTRELIDNIASNYSTLLRSSLIERVNCQSQSKDNKLLKKFIVYFWVSVLCEEYLKNNYKKNLASPAKFDFV